MRKIEVSDQLYDVVSKYARKTSVDLDTALRQLLCRERIVAFYRSQRFDKKTALNLAQTLLQRYAESSRTTAAAS